MDDSEVTLKIYAPSISVPEHKQLRDAVDAANVQGTITWLCNSAGARVAAIVPVEIAERGTLDNG